MKRGTPLRRGKPLRRLTRLRARGDTKYRRRERFVDYMLVVKSLPCVARHMGGCAGEVQADHAGRRGIGQKCHDREVISLCARHHHQRTNFSGPFRSWNQADMRVWLLSQIKITQWMAAAKGANVP